MLTIIPILLMWKLRLGEVRSVNENLPRDGNQSWLKIPFHSDLSRCLLRQEAGALRVVRNFFECHKIQSIEFLQMSKEQFPWQTNDHVKPKYKHLGPRESKLLKDG